MYEAANGAGNADLIEDRDSVRKVEW